MSMRLRLRLMRNENENSNENYEMKSFHQYEKSNQTTVILKCPLFLAPSLYEVNSIQIACKCVPLIKPKPILIVFI